MDESRIPQNLKNFFDEKVKTYNNPAFIEADPVCIPHLFTKPQDIEVAGFFAAIFAWGNRTTIIQKSKELLRLMDNAPHDFVVHHTEADLKKMLHFKHRTFQADDVLYFIAFLQHHFSSHTSLESAFSQWMDAGDTSIEKALIGFKRYFFSLEHLRRTQKHISSPEQNSSCKRLCMYLRWMVRRDKAGVDFGLWRTLKPAQLVCPIDVHVARVAKRFGLMERKLPDWQAALELTAHLRNMDPKDPAKYDYALFGLGVIEKYV